MMNSPFVIEQSRRLAARDELSTGSPEDRVRRLYERLFGREPDERERALGVAFLREQEQAGPSLPPLWSYGSARLDASAADFRPFAHWTGKVWQPVAAMPAPETGHLQWHSIGGHTGPDDAHSSAVLRWTAPHDAIVRIDGTLGHPNAQGDGVRGRVVSSRAGVLGEWVAHNAKVPTRVDRVEVKRGDTFDFMVDRRQNDNSDSFTWVPVIHEDGESGETWDAKADFHGPVGPGLTPWEEYAQVLLLTNEFVFVD